MKLLLWFARFLLRLPAGGGAGGGQEGAPKRRMPAGRRLMLTAGVFGLVAGVSLIGLGAYDLLHHSEAAPRRSSHPVIRAFPAADAPAVYDRSPSTPTPAPATPTPVPATPPPLRDVPYRITIPKIGVNAPVATYGLDANGVPEVPLNKYDVAWYNFSSEPGAGGNAVFAGHVTWNGAAVFYNLDKLAAGDEVLLEGNDGTKLRYTVKEVFLVDPDDPGSVAVMGPTPTDTITLITCGGQPFYIGGTFRYDYTHRLVVRGALAQVERPSSGAGG